ncbi:DUF2784 domain-containing protein [Aestuariicella hydrocarbonica]|uniref:DUF2784 domain-containing protein n=1 Tax=Pseudomaricurvus hydrocarbonicus TaxID=1470433 RepID=A0A9E5T3C7_9GAMM|nr:DUF2784 domain-containing protein [Aestuariicella hydrocarbonica]NHO67037.1 DUF2784 domain-containing protein [Aestuariicella hydrocarbonica]
MPLNAITNSAPFSTSAYLLAADVMLVMHTLFVIFVILGLILIVMGKLLNWRWVRNFWFRLAHIIAIGIVVMQAWLGILCPLTGWEMALRERGGEAIYSGTFIAYWLGKVLYYPLPEWVFITGYSVFGAWVVGCWFWVRPRPL